MKISKDSWLITRPIAHRGLHTEYCPENSMGAFQRAVNHNQPIELDVQLTTDGVLFVFHDWNTLRVTGVDYPTNKISSKQLDEFNLKNTEYHIPTLDQVLKLVDGNVPLLIEIKNESFERVLEKNLHERLSKYNGEYAIQSFNPLSIKYMRKCDSNYIIGQLSSDFLKNSMSKVEKWFLSRCFLNFMVKPDFISYDIKALPKKYIDNQREKGTRLLCWTVRSHDDRKKAENMCDNYIYEKISLE